MEHIKISDKPLEPLCCVVCDVLMFRWNEAKQRYVPLELYREATLYLNNGAQMTIGICVDCRPQLDDILGEAILMRHRVFWNSQLAADPKLSDENRRINIERNKALTIQRISYGG